MPKAAIAARAFHVRARHIDAHHGHIVSEASFEAAAIAYVERYPHDLEGELRVIVRDAASGQEHCFIIDMDTGETGPCE
ncbi:MAG TPA: DUF5961 family protein [Caulobacteraceae bacterium]